MFQMLLSGARSGNTLLCTPHPFVRHVSSSLTKKRNIVVILTGATATGKSAAAEYLCTQHQHHLLNQYEVVVADSVQAMRHLNIGANKPSAEVMAAIPHHMVNLHEPGELYSAGQYCRHARDVVADILKREKVPLIVGGNTMWVDWLVKGAPNAPQGSKNVKIQAAKLLAPYMAACPTISSSHNSTEGNQSGHNDVADSRDYRWEDAVAEVDRHKGMLLAKGQLAEEVSSSIHMSIAVNDWYRLHRLLEIILTLEQSRVDKGYTENNNSIYDNGTCQETVPSDFPFKGLVSELKSTFGVDIDLRCFFLGGDRIALYKSIDQRCIDMVSCGLLNEVTDLYCRNHIRPLPQHTSGYAAQSSLHIDGGTSTNSMSPTASAAIGYRQTLNYLCRENYVANDTQAFYDYINRFATATRNYAKRQLHWYRNDHRFLWIHDLPNNLNMREGKYQKSDAPRRIAEEIYHWVYSVSKEDYESNLHAQYWNAKEFAVSNEMKELKHNVHLLKAKFNSCTLRSGESFILRSCEGALNRAALKRYSSDAIGKLTEAEVDAMCSVADSCRRKLMIKSHR